ncbi:MAG: prepilin peptidase [Chromatiales bacterium 21-64-14]|nr:MAG: prepilin peptidase [Chromatiales bacterium 21-64-14]HQU14883.1 A24 family peptidase [Gammaproteobacteria bacterium]
MPLIELLQQNPVLLAVVAGVLGLMIGSFLNVVIHRLPIMLERDWREQCVEWLGDGAEPGPAAETFNLVAPRSRCPHCGQQISAAENIPVISYLLLGGRCSTCKAHISIRYPLVELATAGLSALVVWHFGYGPQAGAALLLTWALICLTLIDIDHQQLPDLITLPFLWLGLMLSLPGVFTGPRASILGAVIGYMSLWTVYKLFKAVTGKEGMGYGDFKLLAMLGAWFGWQSVPLVILLSSVVGAAVGITLLVVQHRERGQPMPFGPYLGAAGWIAMLWGNDLIRLYWSWFGVR